MSPSFVKTFVKVMSPLPRNRMSPEPFDSAKTRLPLARSSRPSTPTPLMKSRAVKVITPAVAVMSVIKSSCASTIEPSVAERVTLFPAVIAPIPILIPLTVVSNETLPAAPPALTRTALTGPAAITSIDPLAVERLVRVMPFPPRRRMSPDVVDEAVTLLLLASSSRPSTPTPLMKSRAVKVITPAVAVMSVIASSCASTMEPTVALRVTLVPAVIAPILIPLTVVSNVTLPAPPALSRTALSGPAAVTSIDPSTVETLVSVMPSVSPTTMSPVALLFAVRLSTLVSILIPVAAFAKRLLVVTSTKAVPFCDIEPRSPSAAPSPTWSRSAFRKTL